jgi:RNA-directed DNA polymerase
LKAGYVEYGALHETHIGTPQGGVISPLLANISLHGMEIALQPLSGWLTQSEIRGRTIK